MSQRRALSAGADKVAYFEGTPIPTSIILAGVLALAAWTERLGENLYGGVWTLGPWRIASPGATVRTVRETLMISKTAAHT